MSFFAMPRLPDAVILATLALALPAAATAQGHFPTTEDAKLMARYLVEDGETPGIVLGFIDADGSTRVIHHGEAGPGARSLGPRSAFEIGSITKTFTAALLADMVARGEMALDDPVQDYLPDGVTMPGWEGRQITLVDLATHHSGLPRMPDNFEPADPEDPYADYGTEQLYDFLSNHELRREPGTEYEYSNLAVGLLGHVLELAEWMTKGHDDAGDVVPHWNAMAMVGAGGIRSSVEDMLTYVAAQVGPASSEIERAMRMTHEPRVERGEDQAGGLGWGIRTVGERRILSHGGGTGGYSTWIGFDPGLGVGVVMLTNTGDFDDDIGSDLLRRGCSPGISYPVTTFPVSPPRRWGATRATTASRWARTRWTSASSWRTGS